MCGIVYVNNFNGLPASRQVAKRYKRQRNRGTDGFGFYLPKINRLTHNTREHRILRELVTGQAGKASEIMFHHRYPTSTANVRNACHPFSTRGLKHNYVLVHNGVIMNDYELQADHEARGIEYVSMQDNGRFNDSEALLYDVALYLEGEQDALKARGQIAFVVVENDKQGKPLKLHFARNSSPLKMVFNKQMLALASEGKGVDILAHTLYTFDYKTKQLTNKALTIPEYVYTAPGYNTLNDNDWLNWHKPIVTDESDDQPTEWRTLNTAAASEYADELLNMAGELTSAIEICEDEIADTNAEAREKAKGLMTTSGEEYNNLLNEVEVLYATQRIQEQALSILEARWLADSDDTPDSNILTLPPQMPAGFLLPTGDKPSAK